MNRLTHDFHSYLRACQISASDFFCLVEGADCDAYFFDQISAPVFDEYNLNYEIQTANILTRGNESGGKQRLLSFFEFLRKEKKLSAEFSGKKTSFIIFLDKDVDDVTQKIKRSRRVIYTEYYDVQGYLFHHGNLIKAAAAAASLPLNKVQTSLGQQSHWLNACAFTWKEWIIFCVFFLNYDISLGGYGLPSQIHTPCYGALDNTKKAALAKAALKATGLKKTTYNYMYEQITKIVNEIFAKNKEGIIFKGKWYLEWLVNHLHVHHGKTIGKKEISSALNATLDFNEPWTLNLRRELRRVIKTH